MTEMVKIAFKTFTNMQSQDVQVIFKWENYVLMKLNYLYERSMLCQFRCGILLVRTETGRYIMKDCADSMEDEKHFSLVLWFSRFSREITAHGSCYQSDDKLSFLLNNYRAFHVMRFKRFKLTVFSQIYVDRDSITHLRVQAIFISLFLTYDI